MTTLETLLAALGVTSPLTTAANMRLNLTQRDIDLAMIAAIRAVSGGGGGAGDASAANQVAGNNLLTTISSKDFATQATLVALLAKVIAAPSTEAKQDTGNTSLAAILAKQPTAPALESGNLATIAGKDFATQATLAAVLAKIIAAPSTEAKQDTANASLTSILAKIIASPATEATQATGNALLTEIRNGVAVDYSVMSVGAAGAAVTRTLPAAGVGVRNVFGGIAWSLSGTPASAVTVSVSDGATEFIRWYVTVGGPSGVLSFPRPIRGTANTAMTATVSAPGGSIIATINLHATRTE